ncbi:DUF1294 domain-containing protein [Halalkalibacter wakoensis]|uniref:DUF1294 domain-containing protein n=1 Tax=Halalkalibacter wakoensis TaxID=127891 RepID=UPI00054F0455|nr:DUF1294 domain-containing protein [Halalkalibacter wakoensis]
MLLYVIFVNLLSFVIMGLDKSRAKQRKRRVPERLLFLLALLGGSIGVYMGMKRFRHKTKHYSFSVGVPIIIFAQLGILVFILFYVSA